MNVRTLCLSVLYQGEATGYDIRRQCSEGKFSYFVEASYGSIYPALAKLEDDGLVTSRLEQQDGKPSRKIYAITDAGRQAFADELSEPLGEDVFRSPFLLFARFVHILPRDLVEARCHEFLGRMEARREQLGEAETDHQCGPADQWIIAYGRAIHELADKYMRDHMHELITLARPQLDKDAAE